jgi:hypothetical protein
MNYYITFILLLVAASFLSPAIQAAPYDPRTVGKSYLEPPPSFLQQQQSATILNSETAHHPLHAKDTLRGGGLIPAGYNPFGYKITPIGVQFLEFNGSLECDLGRFIASIKERKTLASIKSQWLEIVRVSKSAQSMRIYRTLQEIIDFCLDSGFIN